MPSRPTSTPCFLLACSLSLAGLGLPAMAQTSLAGEEASHITAVKLYPGSATVERTLQLPPGARQASFTCLPAGLDAASLQTRSDAGVEIGDLSVRQQPRALLGQACASPLDEQIRKLEDEIAALEAEAAGIGFARGYLKSFEGGRPQVEQIESTIYALRQSGQRILVRQHEIEQQQEQLERKLQPLLAERDRTGDEDTPVSTVSVTVDAPQGGELRLRYQVRGPGWQPAYRATLDSETGKLNLQRLAQVAQNSGEDWDAVPLTLSTGQPSAATDGPLPRPWRIGIQPDTPVTAGAPQMMAAPSSMAAKARSAVRPEADAGFDVSVFQGSFATEFSVPQPVTVPANGERITLTLDAHDMDTELRVRTTPALDASAWLIASFKAPSGVWPAGPVKLYRDGAYVGSSRFDATRSARNGLSFGRDELINVRMERPEQMQGTRGIIGSRKQRIDTRHYVVENRHDKAVTVQVLDAAPISEHENVRITSQYEPKPQTERWHDEPGTIAWEQSLAAGASQNFSAQHEISWPKDERLRER